MSAGAYGTVAYSGSGDTAPEQFLDLDGAGIAGGEAFGTTDSSVLNATGPQGISATGIASGLEFGLLIRNPMHATGIASAEAFGSLDIVAGISLDVDDRSIIISDTFTEGSNIDLIAHTPDIDTVGTGWVDWSTDAAVTINSTSDKATGDDSGAVIDAGVTDYELSVDAYMDRDSGNRQYPGLVVKGNINIDGYMLWMGPSAGSPQEVDLIFHAYRDHSYTHVATLAVGTETITDLDTVELKARVDGRIVTGWVDGVETFKVDVDAYAFVREYLDRENSTHVGVSGWGDSLSTWDNFLVKSIDDSYGIPSDAAVGIPASVDHANRTIDFEPLLVIDDQFIEATKSQVALNAHTVAPLNTPAGSWTAWNGATGTIVGGANALGAIWDDEWVLDAGTGNARVTMDIWPHRDSVSEWPGVLIRGVDASNYIYAVFATDGTLMDIDLHTVVATVDTVVAGPGAWNPLRASSYLWKRELTVEVVDDVIDVYIDGVLDFSHTLTGGDETTFAKAGAQYMGIASVGTGVQTHVDRFRVWDLDATGAYGIASGEAVGENGVVTQGLTISTNGVESGEAFGNADLAQIIDVTGIASAAAVGTPSNVAHILNINVNGIASGEAFGSHDVSSGLSIDVTSNGIASAEAFGSAYLSIMATGIASAEAVGSAAIAVNIAVTSIASAEAFGSATVTPGAVNIAATGIASAEAVGSPALSHIIAASGIVSAEAFGNADLDLNIVATGIASAEAVGSATVAPGAVNIAVTGIASAEAFGSARIGQPIDATGIPSAAAFGSATVSPGAVNIAGTGIASAAAFGSPALSHIIAGTGITSSEAFGSPDLIQIITGTGINDGNLFGNADITSTAAIAVTGIASAEAFGSPALSHIIDVTGIATAEAFGNVDLSQIIDVTGIASAAAFGNAAITTGNVVILVTGIASGEAFGTPIRVIITEDGCQVQAIGDESVEQTITGVSQLQTIGDESLEQTVSTISLLQTISTVEIVQVITVCERGLRASEGVDAVDLDNLLLEGSGAFLGEDGDYILTE